ncbi:hypothetical protein PTNB85_10345 [Pyrenophora teres f. teres]|nr:hypothetical protein PTNB85_10345 [Pyrenophora teres f. teres]KAE8835176.1 hypothetical protein HRS9122_07446 [Pyrenophora teres f. teres]
MLRSCRRLDFIVVAVFVLCAWFLFDAHFNDIQDESVKASAAEKPWRHDATKVEEEQKTLEQEIVHGGTEEQRWQQAGQAAIKPNVAPAH